MKLAARIKKIEFEAEPDSCTENTVIPKLVIEFDVAGVGCFVRIKSGHMMAMNIDDVVPFGEFLEWVCEQNDRIMKDELA